MRNLPLELPKRDGWLARNGGTVVLALYYFVVLYGVVLVLGLLVFRPWQ